MSRVLAQKPLTWYLSIVTGELVREMIPSGLNAILPVKSRRLSAPSPRNALRARQPPAPMSVKRQSSHELGTSLKDILVTLVV